MLVLVQPAENHHVCPIHPEYAELPPQTVDGAAAKALMDEAGMGDFEHELISIDDNWRKEQLMRLPHSCVMQVSRLSGQFCQVQPSGMTGQNIRSPQPTGTMRPLGVQVLVWLTGLVRPGMKRPSAMKSSTHFWPRQTVSPMPMSAVK